MSISSVQIKNIRSISDLRWAVPTIKAAGWHVIIGDNGTGKSTFLRALALTLIGPREAIALRQDWNDWMRKGQPPGSAETWLFRDLKFDPFKKLGKGRQLAGLNAGIKFERGQNGSTQIVPQPLVANESKYHSIWGPGDGWFSAGARGTEERRRAEYTIDVCGLNARDALPAAREEYYVSYRERLIAYRDRRNRGEGGNVLRKLSNSVTRMAHRSVWLEMKRQRESDDDLRRLFGQVPQALSW